MTGPQKNGALAQVKERNSVGRLDSFIKRTRTMKLPTLAVALFFALATSLAHAQGGGGGSAGGGGGSSAGGGAPGGASSGPTTGTSSAAGTPNAGSAGGGTSAVSGVPNGPANVGGLNNTGNDPSDAGNSAKSATSPGANAVGTANWSGRTSTNTGSRGGVGNAPSPGTNAAGTSDSSGGAVRANGTRASRPRGSTVTREPNSDAKIDAENRKLDRMVKSICKGC
jgi:hypothetical protein